MFFEVGLFTGAIWLSGLLTTSLAANQIALSLALTFMFAMGLSAVTIRVGNQKGLMDCVRGAIHIFISNTLRQCSLLYLSFSTNIYLKFFVNVNDMSHVVETKEVIEIASQLLFVAAFFKSQTEFKLLF
jgi:MATE family multidrug resistance protein